MYEVSVMIRVAINGSQKWNIFGTLIAGKGAIRRGEYYDKSGY